MPCSGVGSKFDDTKAGAAETGRNTAPEATADEHAKFPGKVHGRHEKQDVRGCALHQVSAFPLHRHHHGHLRFHNYSQSSI